MEVYKTLLNCQAIKAPFRMKSSDQFLQSKIFIPVANRSTRLWVMTIPCTVKIYTTCSIYLIAIKLMKSESTSTITISYKLFLQLLQCHFFLSFLNCTAI